MASGKGRKKSEKDEKVKQEEEIKQKGKMDVKGKVMRNKRGKKKTVRHGTKV